MSRSGGMQIPPDLIARVARGIRGAARGLADGWFGPMTPMPPQAPASVLGRAWDYPSGFNTVARPRAHEPVSFPQLRRLADSYDLMRLVIETRKDQLVKCGWAVQPRDGGKAATKDPRVNAVSDFLAMPDQEHDWDTWLRMLVEDMLVIDAATLYPRRTRAGGLYALEPVDGATITRLIDGSGRTPAPPAAAYQQVLHGLPANNYTRDELLYLPRNLRSNRVYGLSPVEQVIMTINIALRRQLHQLQYYTEGTVPDALGGVPESWTPQQISEFQGYWDALMEDNTAQRRKVRWVPGSIAKAFVQTKDGALKDEYDEWLARIMCYAFNVSNQPFIKQQSRAESETSAEAALREGLAPLKRWIKSVIDRCLRQCWGYSDLEFVWRDEADVNALTQAQINDTKVRAGRMTINEWRAEDGDEAIEGGDVPLIYTASGAVRLADVVQPPPAEPEPTPANVPSRIVPEDETAPAAPPLAKRAPFGRVDHDRPLIRRRRRQVGTMWTRLLAGEGRRVAGQVAARWGEMAKAADGPQDEPQSPALATDGAVSGAGVVGAVESATAEDAAAGSLARAVRLATALMPPDAIAAGVSRMTPALTEVAADGAAEGLRAVGIDEANATALANPRAVAWAREHAAELVSNLTETTRTALRDLIVTAEGEGWSVARLQAAIVADHAFSAARARLIAQHELARADGMGNLTGWRVAVEQYGLTLLKHWIEAPDEVHCPACDENVKAGAIGLDEMFPSGHLMAPAHPHCGCDVVSVSAADDAEKWEGPCADGPFDLAKANPYHDHLGRFAAAPETGGSRGRPRPEPLGPMPHEIVGSTLGRRLEPGPITLSARARDHHRQDHAGEETAFRAVRARGLGNPAYVGVPKLGDDGLNTVLYYPVPEGKGMMFAIPVSLDRDGAGAYRARSGFLVAPHDVQRRRDSGTILKSKAPPKRG